MNKNKGEGKVTGYLFYDFVKWTAALPGLIYFRPRWYYSCPEAREKIKGGALVISNHAGFFDPIYVMTAIWNRRHHFICAKEFMSHPVARFFFKRFHCIPIDRENFGMDSFHEIIDLLKDDRVVSMFPEGHVSTDASGGMDAFKSGMVLMALKSGKPIVPVYVKKEKKPFARLKLAVGRPFRCEGTPTLSAIREITDLLHEEEQKLKEICENGE